jgi:hypothetical protein
VTQLTAVVENKGRERRKNYLIVIKIKDQVRIGGARIAGGGGQYSRHWF